MPLSDHGRVRKQQFHDRLGILHHRTLHRKLKERFPAAFNTRWTRQHWLHASLFLTLGVLLATIVPGFSAQLQPASQANATLPLQLPPLTMKSADRDAGAYWEVVQVESGERGDECRDELWSWGLLPGEDAGEVPGVEVHAFRECSVSGQAG